MRPSDRTIRDELRREAAKVPIPNDMWQNISRRLDDEPARRERHRRMLAVGEQWRPAVILAVAAGFFWFALIPSLPGTEPQAGATKQPAIVAPAVQDSLVPVKSHTTRESEPAKASAGQEVSTTPPRFFPTVPQ